MWRGVALCLAWAAALAACGGHSYTVTETEHAPSAGAPSSNAGDPAAAGAPSSNAGDPAATDAGASAGTGAVVAPPEPPECGNGVHDEGEACDDGNLMGDDGCSAACQVEDGWRCPPAGLCDPGSCGDGVLQPWESCDDGNRVPGDGCNASCAVAPGSLCPAPGRSCRGKATGGEGGNTGGGGEASEPYPDTCGDGSVQASEQCDLGSPHNDGTYGGCTADCRYAPFCGDGVVDAAQGEECDDGPDATAPRYTGTAQGGCAVGCRLPGYCGDGRIQARYGEMCDDGPRNGAGRCHAGCILGGK